MPAADRVRARQLLRERRTSLDAAARRARDQDLAPRLIAMLAESGIRPGVLAGYWPMHGEPDPREALQVASERGWRLALPEVVARGQPLRFLAWSPGDAVIPGLLGTTQPAQGAPTVPDVILLPCLGVDPRGFRLGYGGGFYDRTLADLAGRARPPLTIGVVDDFAAIRDFTPAEHDRALDRVISLASRTPPWPGPS